MLLPSSHSTLNRESRNEGGSVKTTEGLESHEADTLSAVSVVPHRDGAEGNITVQSDKIKICPCSAECTKNTCLNGQKSIKESDEGKLKIYSAVCV